MKKIAITMSVIFCFAALANAQRPWSSTSFPGKSRASSQFYKAGKPGCKKHFRRDGKSFERKNRKGFNQFNKAGFNQNRSFGR